MLLNDGIASFYRFDDSIGSGNMPEKSMTQYHSGWYGERTVGFSRYFTAQQASTRVDKLIRVLHPSHDISIRADDVCVLRDGHVYKIVQAQFIYDEDAGRPCIDISLERVGDKFDTN